MQNDPQESSIFRQKIEAIQNILQRFMENMKTLRSKNRQEMRNLNKELSVKRLEEVRKKLHSD